MLMKSSGKEIFQKKDLVIKFIRIVKIQKPQTGSYWGKQAVSDPIVIAKGGVNVQLRNLHPDV